MRILLKFITYSLLIIFVPFIIVTTVLRINLLDDQYYTKNLEESEFYLKLDSILVDVIDTAVEESIENAVSESVERDNLDVSPVYNALRPTILDSAVRIFDKEIIEEFIETNAELSSDYANGDLDEANFFIPRSYFSETLKTEIPIIYDEVSAVIDNFEVCSSERLREINNSISTNEIVVLDCVPEDFKSEFSDEQKQVAVDNIDEVIANLNSEIIQGEDVISLEELIEISSENELEATQTKRDLDWVKDVPNAVKAFDVILVISWVIMFVLVISYILTSKNEGIAKVLSLKTPLLTIGLTLLIPLAIIRASLPEISEEIVNEVKDSTTLKNDVTEVFVNYTKELTLHITDQLLFAAVIVFGLGIIFLVISLIVHQRSKNPKEEAEKPKTIKDVLEQSEK